MIYLQLSNTLHNLDLYADDAKLHCSHSDLSVVEARLQSDLDAVALCMAS